MGWTNNSEPLYYEFTAKHNGVYFFGVRKAWFTAGTDERGDRTYKVRMIRVR